MMIVPRVVAAAGLSMIMAGPVNAQEAAPEDVESIDAIVAAVYDVISGPAGEARDWDRWMSLFVPEARLIPTGLDQDGAGRYSVLTPSDYAERAGPQLEQNGFFETELHQVVERFGPVAHLFSSYESRRTPGDPEPFARGINSFQLYHDGNRWWVVTIFWSAERPDLPLPAEFEGH